MINCRFISLRVRDAGNHLLRAAAILLAAAALFGPVTSTLAGEKAGTSDRIIQYRGPMPFLRQENWGGEVELKFELYRSPTGGSPFWTEAKRVRVMTNGWVNVDLGEVERLPDEAFTSPFRFLSIWHGRHEFAPRKQIASVVYVASAYEAGVSKDNYIELSLAAAKTAAAKVPDREKRLDDLVECGEFSMEMHPRFPATWLEAEATAARVGAHLPTFEEWYGAYDGKPAGKLVSMEGHYEWVVPWVYEPSIHARMHELYRGKPVACYYNEISPLNAYPFRLLKRSQNSR
jgi:hypothetical protein